MIKKYESEKFRLPQNKIKTLSGSLKLRNNFLRTKGTNLSKYIHELKKGEQSKYNSLFYKKKVSPFSSKKKLGNNSHRIVIMHEEIKSLSNEQFMKRLGNIENMKSETAMKNDILNENIENLQNEINKYKTTIKQLELKSKEFADNTKKISKRDRRMESGV